MKTKQQEAVNLAKEKLKDKPWFEGVCIDNLPTEEECKENLEDAVNSIVFETCMWDAPDFMECLAENEIHNGVVIPQINIECL